MKRLLLTLPLLCPTALSSQELHTFSNGEVADAEKINENFVDVDQRLRAIEDALKSVPFGGCFLTAVPDGTVSCTDLLVRHTGQTDVETEGFSLELTNGGQISYGTEATPSGTYDYVAFEDFSEVSRSYATMYALSEFDFKGSDWIVKARLRIVSAAQPSSMSFGASRLWIQDGTNDWGFRFMEDQLILMTGAACLDGNESPLISPFDTTTDYIDYVLTFSRNDLSTESDDSMDLYANNSLIFENVRRQDLGATQCADSPTGFTVGSRNSATTSETRVNYLGFFASQ